MSITANKRTADYPIDPMFLTRWSPRAFNGEPISQADLFTMLEAARWAPSSNNLQPWRFIYALRDTPKWDVLLNLLVPVNQSWARDASALVVLVSDTMMKKYGSEEKIVSPTHALDAGTASGFFALQACKMGWHVHGMAGFDRDRAITDLKLPAGFHPHAVYAVGKEGDPSKLPEMLRQREFPNSRVSLAQLVFEGTFQV